MSGNLIKLDEIAEGRRGIDGRPVGSERRVVRPGSYGGAGSPVRRRGHRRGELPAPLRLAVRSAREAEQAEQAEAAGAGRAPGSAASEPASGARRIRAIDGYRGIAAVMVIVLHATLAGRELFPGTKGNVLHDLDICLPIFFVLSGMVAYMGVVRGTFGGRIRGTRELLVSRLWRILPVYYVVVLLVWSLRFAGTGDDWHDLFLHLTFTQVWSSRMIYWLDGPSWFLADDMHFFLLVALVGPLLARFAAGRRAAGVKLALLTAFPLALIALGVGYNGYIHAHAHPLTTQLLYSPIAKVDEFAEGMLLGVILSLPGVVRERARTGLGLSLAGIAGIVAMGYLRWHSTTMSTYAYELSGIPVMVMLTGALMLSPRQLLTRALSSRPLQFLSMVGFTVFLVQEPVMLQLEQLNVLYFQDSTAWWVSTVALVMAATFTAWLAYRLIEQPAQRLRGVLREMRARQRAGLRRRRGPAPRRLPDLVLHRLDGESTSLRGWLGERPLLIALGVEGERRLDEHAFRLAAGEAAGIVVRERAGRADRAGRGGVEPIVLLDPERRLAAALGVPAVLVEVAPDGLITAIHVAEGDEVVAPIEPEASLSDIALAEHLHAQLTPEEERVVELMARGLSARQVAATVELSVERVAEVETDAEEKAIQLTLAFHDDMICEPAALAQADGPAERIDAVAEHVRRCRPCRVEFGERIATVLRHAGELVEPERVPVLALDGGAAS